MRSNKLFPSNCTSTRLPSSISIKVCTPAYHSNIVLFLCWKFNSTVFCFNSSIKYWMLLVWLKVQSFTDCRFFYLADYYDICWLLTIHCYCLTTFFSLASETSPDKGISFILYPHTFTHTAPNSYRASVCYATLPPEVCLIWSSVRQTRCCRIFLSDYTSQWTPLYWLYKSRY